VIAVAEVLQDQLKGKRRGSTRSKSKTQQPFSSQSVEDLLSFLNGPHSDENDCLVCIVIHNIDGPALRDPDSQQFLARIACCSHVSMVASIDHVNAPLCKCHISYVNSYIFSFPTEWIIMHFVFFHLKSNYHNYACASLNYFHLSYEIIFFGNPCQNMKI